jgi:hypothetical protein
MCIYFYSGGEFFSDFIDVYHDFCAIKIQENKYNFYYVTLMNLKKEQARHGKQ